MGLCKNINEYVNRKVKIIIRQDGEPQLTAELELVLAEFPLQRRQRRRRQQRRHRRKLASRRQHEVLLYGITNVILGGRQMASSQL